MKIVISKSLVQSILGVSGATAGAFAVYEREVQAELGIDSTDESEVQPKSKKFGFIPHFSDIKSFRSTVYSVSRTDTEVVIEIKDAFIEDVAELGSKLIRKCMPLALQQIKLASDLSQDVSLLETKWKAKPKSAEDISA